MYEEALPYVRKDEERSGLSRHFHEWSLHNRIISRHLDRGALALAQAALWRAEESILRRLSALTPEIGLNSVEEDLFHAVEFYRRNGLLLQEPGFYRLYLRYLFARDRLDEIPGILTLAIQRAERFQLRTLQDQFAEDLQRWKVRVAESPGEAPPPGLGAIDLQPLEMISHGKEGELVRGRFSLVNQGPVELEGTLQIVAAVEADAWNAASDTWAVALGGETEGRSEAIALQPGERRVIYLETLLNDGEETVGEAQLRWKGHGDPASWWRFRTEPEGRTVSVVQASLAMDNPFYSVPLYQEIYYRGDGERVIDFRVRTSHPAHVEIIDVDTGRLIAIDSTGNARFDGVGDAVFHDLNRNGYPDLLFDGENDVAAVELHVFPHSGVSGDSPPGEVLVFLETRDSAGEWRRERENRLLTGQPEQ